MLPSVHSVYACTYIYSIGSPSVSLSLFLSLSLTLFLSLSLRYYLSSLLYLSVSLPLFVVGTPLASRCLGARDKSISVLSSDALLPRSKIDVEYKFLIIINYAGILYVF